MSGSESESTEARSRTAQLSLRMRTSELERVRTAALVSGETVAQFVREAVRERCLATQERVPGNAVIPAGEAAARLRRAERLVLAAVASRHGIRSVAAAAAAAGVSWSAARGALDALVARDAVRHRRWKQSWRGGVREVGAWELNVASADFEDLVAQTAQVRLPPQSPPAEHSGPLPPQFWPLFWNHPAPSQLRLPDDADYVANRLVNGPSPVAALWASVHLPTDALQGCLRLRSTRARRRHLIENQLAARVRETLRPAAASSAATTP
ncbi:hypothetical protein [Candidatus Poriferisodalis sp.]|uniref:hypothetical protein n=1 Tax=Candidatus Poriferisodalis sp. TaxID=3101277 RepID=UPI003B02A174